MKIGVVVFPGSNCDHDCQHVFKDVLGQYVEMIWHKETLLAGLDAVVLPGGFSYGDYLRTGAIARFSPVMGAVKEFAKKGGAVCGNDLAQGDLAGRFGRGCPAGRVFLWRLPADRRHRAVLACDGGGERACKEGGDG